jgi:isoquinoline 1-oxidoreductase beta subunit
MNQVPAWRRWTRRGFLAVGGLAGGGIVLATAGAFLAPDRLTRLGRQNLAGHMLTWLAIAPDDTVTVLVPQAEMGQGAQTALAQMAADELDADWSRVRVLEAPPDEAYLNGYFVQAFAIGDVALPAVLQRALNTATVTIAGLAQLQITGGSMSVRATGDLGMRRAGAAARAMLIGAAAEKWNVPAARLITANSVITDPVTGQNLRYGELVEAATKQPFSGAPVLKKSSRYKFIGKSVPRFDIPAKIDGSARYGIDAALPGMLYASIVASPVFGAKLVSVDEKPALSRRGVVRVVRLADAVAVVADSFWRAKEAVLALSPVWEIIAASDADSAHITAVIKTVLDKPTDTDHKQGDGKAGLNKAAKIIEAEYAVPFLAHAPMEPPNATVRIVNGTAELWTGTQDPLNARNVVAKATGLSPENVTVHNALLGGGFGRRLPYPGDYIDQAARIAMVMAPLPVKLIWPREQDIQRDYYRMAAAARFRGGLDDSGALIAWHGIYAGAGSDDAARLLYDVPHQLIEYGTPDHHVRLGYWRSVDHSFQCFFTETFIDELAYAAAMDPYAFRLARLAGRPRAVLQMAAEKSGWGSKMPAGQGRGIAIGKAFGSYVAHVAEVSVAADGTIKVLRVVSAVDCGGVVNPDGAVAQIEGGIIFGLSAALWGEITIKNGAVMQSSFPDYPVAKLADAPAIEVHFVDSGGARGGLGEPGVPPIAPAIGNAIFAATGKRSRALPLGKA